MALMELRWEPKQRRIDFHRNALVQKGNFEDKVFVVSNVPVKALMRDLYKDLYKGTFDVLADTNDPAAVPTFLKASTNAIKVAARPADLGKLEVDPQIGRPSDGLSENSTLFLLSLFPGFLIEHSLS